MATAEEGGATTNTTSSSYGGGGAGGKFRKKPFRRQGTPYDRPVTALRGPNINNNSNSSWLTKLVVEPASKLISYGADRFFASVFRRRLPPSLPPQPPEVNADVRDEDQVAGLDECEDGAQEPGGVDSRQLMNSSSNNVVLELEQLLKQKTFTRSEVVHLTGLLQSRAVEASVENASQKNEDNASDFGRHQEFASGLLEGNRDGGFTSAVVSTPVHNSKVLEDDIASPAEVAKAYMGSRPSKVSPSELGMRSQLGRENAGLLSTMPFASKSSIISTTKKTSANLGARENGFITPRSRSRSAIYNMARTPYSRVHPTSIHKGSGINNIGYAGPSTSSPLSLVENNEKFESQPMSLKRRSTVLDDEVGSVGPIRRIRQKSNLLGSRFNHTARGMGIGSHLEHKPELSGGQRNKALKNVVENEDKSVPSTSYAHVSTRSTEVASRILQRLDELTPKEKSSESKLVAGREKSSLKLSPSMLSGKSLRSMEDVGSSKLLLDAHGAHDSLPPKQGKAEESEPKKSVVPSVTWNSVLNNDSAVPLKAFTPGNGTSDSVVNNGVSQPPLKKIAFRMSAQEDSMEQDDVRCNGLAFKSPSEKKGPIGSPLTDNNLAPAEAYQQVKPTIESKDMSPSGLIPGKTNEVGPVKIGEGTSVRLVPASEETKTAPQSEALASSFAASDKPKEANNPPPMFSFSSKVADKFPSLSAESFKRAEPEVGRSNSSDNISVSIGSEVKAPESDKDSHLNLPKLGEINGKCDDVSSSAQNGPLFPSSSPVSFPAVPSRDANQLSTGGSPLFTSSTSITNIVSTGTSTSSTSSGNIFGLVTKPSDLAEPIFKFGSSVDPLVTASPASTTKVEINPISSSSAGSGSSSFGLGSFTNSTGSNLQGSLFASASKPPATDPGTVSQGTSSQLFSSTPAPAFDMNTSSSRPTFGFSSSASSSGPTSLAPVGGPTSSLFNFGVSSTAASSSISASSGVFSYGLSSSSSSTTTAGSSSASTLSAFNFGGPSSTPASLNNTGSSFTSGTSGTFNFGGSSLASSSAPSTAFGSTLQSQKSPIFGSTFTPPSPSTGFAFGGSSSSSSPVFSFTTSSASALSSPSLPNTQPVFGNPPMGGGFAASPVNNDQMNAEDSMAEDPAPPSAPVPVFGQPPVSSPTGFGFGSAAPSQVNPFFFGGQQNQVVAPQNPSPFQASGSLEFNAGGSFSLGSGGGDKSGRKIVKINRNKNRKK